MGKRNVLITKYPWRTATQMHVLFQGNMMHWEDCSSSFRWKLTYFLFLWTLEMVQLVTQHRAQLQGKASLGFGALSRSSKYTVGHSDIRVDFVHMKTSEDSGACSFLSVYIEGIFTCICTTAFYLSMEWGASEEQAWPWLTGEASSRKHNPGVTEGNATCHWTFIIPMKVIIWKAWQRFLGTK